MSGGISQVEFLRIFVTVATVIVIYLPLSLLAFVSGLSLPRHPYSWENIHGSRWRIIVKRPKLPEAWGPLLGPILVVQLFCLIGIMKTARQLFELCIEWICDHSPSNFQRSWMLKM